MTIFGLGDLLDDLARKDATDRAEALRTAGAWLDMWAVHVGNCAGGCRCTCGLTRVQAEISQALDRD